MPTSEFLGKKILFVVAHPDDESFAASGTMLRNRKAGGENYILCATFGEKGRSHLKKPVAERMLKKIRRQELERAARYAGVSRISFPGLPDTELDRNKAKLLRSILLFAGKVKPDYIFSFGPDGLSGHLDHITIGRTARLVARRKRIPFVAFNAHPSIIRQFEKMRARRKHGKYTDRVKHVRHNLRLRIDPRSKLRILRLHKSQQDERGIFPGFSKAELEKILQYEYFRQ